ncbi:uncharacterized protein LOC127952167 [Carassius gibelio]|uniref:uncharacterized protein LOC127952167 n=1 Tax=Carassius gibelio TaxID=101364 RepID=UPI002277D0CF|nr:uncharacterized protein LOC127952167 [Carassius gibelio]XP_052406491.1 uncharacterized protein LOC127952167 [Carassius gibelio]XP_052406493.1 uncharacterized protein LOC127952167 [Carassius gibelio]
MSSNGKTTLEKGGRDPPNVSLDLVIYDLLSYFNTFKFVRDAKIKAENKYGIKKEHDNCWPADDIKRAWGKTQRMEKTSYRRQQWTIVIMMQVIERQIKRKELFDLMEAGNLVKRCAELSMKDTSDQVKATSENKRRDDGRQSTSVNPKRKKEISEDSSSQITAGRGRMGAAGGEKQHSEEIQTSCFSEPLIEMLNQIPEMECHIDLAQEMLGSQIYTRGTICMEYTQSQKQDTKTQEFILLCTKDIGVTKNFSTGKHKSGDNKNKRQKKKATSTIDRSLNQERKPAFQRKPPPKSKTKVKKFQFRLPKIMMSNVRSLPNKIEELREMMEDVENINSDLMFFTETWLNENSPSISFEGYRSYRVDRDARLTHKCKGGGLMVLVNEAWATDVEVENIIITPDYELMVVSIRPHDHPEDAPPLTYIHVYIPPRTKMSQAARDIAGFYNDVLKQYPNGPVFLLGDFNHCDFTDLLDLEQYVTCPTRYSNTLDQCYGNVPGAYRSECSPPLGRSDHNVIHLIPKKKSDGSDPSKDENCTHDSTKSRKQ